MNRIPIFFIFLCHASSLICNPTQLSFTPPLKITGIIDKTTFFLTDEINNQFVLKYHPRGPKRAIHDTLGAYVGKSIGLHINEVEVFSAHDPFNALFAHINPLEPSQVGITTLHVRVPGKSVREFKSMNKDICIKKGLCRERHLPSLIKYPQLCDIVAFDIFIDNNDRHNGNLFFDTTTQQFYAIDMDHGFKSGYALIYTEQEYCFDTLASRAYDFIKTLKKRDVSSQEIKVFKRIKKTLQILIALHSPEQLFDEWMKIAEKADLPYSPREKVKIRKYLEYHIQEVYRLIELLDTIIQMQK